MSTNVKTTSRRGANMIAANPQRLESADGARWATGRNVKGESRDGTVNPVESWTLKARDAAGKMIIVARQATRAAAELHVQETQQEAVGAAPTLQTPANAPALAASQEGVASGESDGQTYAVCGDVWCMVDNAPESDPYFRNPRDVSVSYWTGGRECAEPYDVTADCDDETGLAALAFGNDSGFMPAGVMDANDEYALEALRPLAHGAWSIDAADHRGVNCGGAELRNAQTGETLYLVVEESTGQWVFTYDAGNLYFAESINFAAAEHGWELCSDDAQALAREFLNQPALIAARAAYLNAPGRFGVRDVSAEGYALDRWATRNGDTCAWAPQGAAYCYATRADAWAAVPYFAHALNVSALNVEGL